MTHPRRAARDPLKGATLAVWQSQSRGVLALRPSVVATWCEGLLS
jgi:hypothetical protein